jgi:hypothetical protein
MMLNPFRMKTETIVAANMHAALRPAHKHVRLIKTERKEK